MLAERGTIKRFPLVIIARTRHRSDCLPRRASVRAGYSLFARGSVAPFFAQSSRRVHFPCRAFISVSIIQSDARRPEQPIARPDPPGSSKDSRRLVVGNEPRFGCEIFNPLRPGRTFKHTEANTFL